ncbi:MAG: 50S ribosomal protein L10 [Bacteroidia bacterium]|nr:50S ribosomal protein L10 [Bacteroidia bacterium]
MTKEEKYAFVEELTEKFKEYPNFFITDTGSLNAAEMYALRKLCFNNNVQLQMVKNTLIKKALDNLEEDYAEVYDILKQPSSIFFTDSENPNVPAKVIKQYRKEANTDFPVLKAAVIEASVFKGNENLEALTKLKSKTELIGEVVGLLQSPAKNVISALSSGGQTIAGLIKTLQERESAE